MSATRVHPAIERMEGMDAGFLYLETPTVHMHTLKIAILEPSEHLTFDSFVTGTLARLKRLPPMRRRVVMTPFGLNHPMWVTQRRIDPQRHLHRQRIPGGGTMRDLEVLIGQIASTQLDRRFPLWELHYCEGLTDGRVAVVGKMHHALADGSAANALLGNVTDVRSAAVPPAPDEVYESTDRVPGRPWLVRRALVDATMQVFSLPALLKRTALGLWAAGRYRRAHGREVPMPVLDAPRTSFNGSLTAKRNFATVTLPFAEVRRIRSQHEGVTINDMVLALVSGVLRRWLAAHDEHPSRSLTAGVPVGADQRGAAPRLGGNRVSNMFTTLATDIDDPVERLRHISRTSSSAKQIQQRMGVELMSDWGQFIPPSVFPVLVRAYSRAKAASWHPAAFNATVSNVPGPREPVSVGGARLSDMFSVGPLADGIGLNVTVWSYVTKLNFSLLACADLLPDVEVLASYFPAALAELDLEAATGDCTNDEDDLDADGATG
ncbi:wax ester/triacylglycerol synthase family O-acyltransferase [Aeromicrobium sp.]|uniref:WS/DGAT/MGAT family O-acyltransferase n=1 Tax=Aeromicrobium sp. TaxID=1871063 RepID=UPI0030C48112